MSAIPTNISNLEEIILVDNEDNKTYKINLSTIEANRARNDLEYAYKILQQVKIIEENNGSKKENVKPGTSKSSVINCDNLVNEERLESEDEDDPKEPEVMEQKETDLHIWTKQETLLLIDLYKKNEANFNSPKCRTKQIWKNISKELLDTHGYSIPWFKCTTKFNTLKRTYRDRAH
ncbi:uncharacterized protein [Prorops nasuta]|uniref:uncharacterized protein n=1 Tax=Prorops nasuta TaxID=863751 RepID=UPI0034CEDEF0